MAGTNIYAGTLGDGIFRSTDCGLSWEKINAGLAIGDGAVGCATCINSIVQIGAYLFTGTQGGVFVSTNNGTLWTPVSNGLVTLNVTGLALSGSDVFAGTGGLGVWRRPLPEMITSARAYEGDTPERYILSQNYPNPFNPCTTIKCDLPKSSMSP